jgi:DNA-binding IclR family transcriptional regulator
MPSRKENYKCDSVLGVSARSAPVDTPASSATVDSSVELISSDEFPNIVAMQRPRGRPPRDANRFVRASIRNLELDRAKDDKTVKSARRILEIFEYIASTDGPVTIAELAKNLGYPMSSASVLVNTLRDLCYIQRSADGAGFVPTLRIGLIGERVLTAMPWAGELIRIMESLRVQTGAGVALATETGIFARYIYVLPAREPDVYLRIGALRPIGRCAIGQALLLNKSIAKLRLLLRRVNVEARAQDRIDEATFLDSLDASRKAGYTFSKSVMTQGSAGLAVELPVSRFALPLALGICGHVDFISENRDRLVNLLKAAASTCALIDR